MAEPKATKPDIKNTGNDSSSTSTATVNEANSTTTVKANYSLNTKGKDESKINATITATTQSPNVITVDTTEVTGQSMADYTQTKQTYATVNASEYFKKQPPAVEEAYNSASQTNKEIAGIVNDTFKQLTPNEASGLLVLEKLQEQKQQ